MTLSAFLSTHPVFSFEQAVNTLAPFRNRRAMVDRLKHHVRSGTLKQVSRGVYAVVPRGLSAEKFRPDPFLVGQAIRPDAVFSHHSALELLGVSHTLWKSITLYSSRRRKSLSIDGAKFSVFLNPRQIVVPGGASFGTRKVERFGKLMAVTGPERTLVEGFRRPALVGGLEEFVNSASGFSVLDLDLLQDILGRYQTARVWAAVGWFLERFRREFHVPETILSTCEKHMPSVPQYVERTSRGGTLSKRWNLILPVSISISSDTNETQSGIS
jgi:predicted transcriptional regulator of viral defense system